MKQPHRIVLSAVAGFSFLYADVAEDINTSRLFHLTGEKEAVTLPFAFSSDATGPAGGIAYIRQGLLQPQTTFIGAFFGGSEQDVIVNGTPTTEHFKGAFLYFNDYRLPGSERLFLTFLGVKSYFPKSTYYFDGSHDSNPDDAVITPGDTDFGALTLAYVLPVGEGEHNPEGAYRIKNGFALNREKSGGGMPFVTGRTSVGISFFYQYNSFKNDTALFGLHEWTSNGLRFYLNHDNTDFDINPSRGYQFELKYSRDFGWGDSLQSWDFLAFKYNSYFPLPAFSWTRQNVWAMSLWTGYSFSWDKDAAQPFPGIDAHRPPMWEGARLGGIFRMRGYDTNRFSDKAVFYVTAEYRATLTYNPFRDNRYLPVAIDWFQLVPFIEAGRVHNSYNATLLKDLHIDGGLSIRMMAAQVPVRLDVAFSEESTNVWVMAYHPFDF